MKKDEVPAWFAALFRELVVARQPRQLGADALPIYYDTLREYSEPVLRRSVNALKRSGNEFFPSTVEWVRAAQASIDDMHREAAPRPTLDDQIECATCDDTGWVYVENGVVPCACRATNTRYQRNSASQVRRRPAVDEP
jgi:hypothetical protein